MHVLEIKTQKKAITRQTLHYGKQKQETDDVKRGYVNILLVTYPSYINGTRAGAPHVAKEE